MSNDKSDVRIISLVVRRGKKKKKQNPLVKQYMIIPN